MPADGQVGLGRRGFEEIVVSPEFELRLMVAVQKIALPACRALPVGGAEQRTKPWAGFFLLLVRDSPAGEALIFLVCLADVLGVGLLLLTVTSRVRRARPGHGADGRG